MCGDAHSGSPKYQKCGSPGELSVQGQLLGRSAVLLSEHGGRRGDRAVAEMDVWMLVWYFKHHSSLFSLGQSSLSWVGHLKTESSLEYLCSSNMRGFF